MGWRKISSFDSCDDAKIYGNMYLGIFMGILEDCYDHIVVYDMADYLLELRGHINGIFNCKWFDCSKKCFNTKNLSVSGRD